MPTATLKKLKRTNLKRKKITLGPDGTRTRNPLVRSQVPYPLGHKTNYENCA